MGLEDHHGHNTEKRPSKTTGDLYWVCHTCEETIGRACEVYSRVVGYLRPVSGWNKGKREEFKNRKTYATKKGFK